MLKRDQKNNLSEQLCELVDSALQQENEASKKRDYLGASRMGASCDRSLQYEYLQVPKDAGAAYKGKTLRIFEAGHVFEDLAIGWLRKAGFHLDTETAEGGQHGFSAVEGRFKGHVDGILRGGPDVVQCVYPALWECKSLNEKSWKAVAKRGLVRTKPIYATQIALYQAYMEPEVPGISKNPALFTAINKNTAEIYFEWIPFDGALAQKASDRAVRILKACEAEEYLPRVAGESSHHVCKLCPWQRRCWNL